LDHAPRRGRRGEGRRVLLRAVLAPRQRRRGVAAVTMTEIPHYRFPPASAYGLNRCLFALKSDDAFRARFVKDARAALREMGLAQEDAAALLRADRDALVARGAHPYLVFMADLRLRMEREAVTFE